MISFDNQNPSAVHHFHALSSYTNEHDWVWVIDAKYSLYSKATLKFLAETLQGLKREEAELVCVGIEGRTFDTGAIEAHPPLRCAPHDSTIFKIHLLWWFVAMLSKRHLVKISRKCLKLLALAPKQTSFGGIGSVYGASQ